MSGEVDVILYSPAIMPPALFDNTNGYFPIESALYAIEVKSRIDAEEIRKSISAAKAIRALPHIGTVHSYPTFDERIIESKVVPTPLAINSLFAFGSDLKPDPESELQRYRKYDDKADSAPALKVICIVGRGYWHFSERWKFCPADANHTEVMAWLSGTANTMPGFIVAKGRPRFGNYLFSGDMTDAT
ncbi:DUF6602 domain-containing protein [Mesorhizobium sp. ANAO-SY3R2]|uniref:DUF6602 domain-containing protein n=1 Tax=Mesorhizobium sp. ANAO-SY3R2 TaxID=3166644 RepID=UPI00366ABF37